MFTMFLQSLLHSPSLCVTVTLQEKVEYGVKFKDLLMVL